MVEQHAETDGIGVSNADFGPPSAMACSWPWMAAIPRMSWIRRARPSRTPTSSWYSEDNIADQLDLIVDDEHDIRDLD